ncbi:unnamed protein product [Penicillium camemberti]|uniref:Str. FM013 n=1 Tax=Penicillium camemberti (strain FM 013) TaxID=1429867 RepID=A0A0G4PVZ8_PENC3|nr:unnamed protein product [Penicillium camemberti]
MLQIAVNSIYLAWLTLAVHSVEIAHNKDPLHPECINRWHQYIENGIVTNAPWQSVSLLSAIVTGASSRDIGDQIAYDLGSREAKVAITYSSDRSKSTEDALIQRT